MVRELPSGAETVGWGRSKCFVEHMPVRQATSEIVTQLLSVHGGFQRGLPSNCLYSRAAA